MAQQQIDAIITNAPVTATDEAKKGVRKTLGLLLPRLGEDSKSKMTPGSNIFELIKGIRNQIGLYLLGKGMIKGSPEINGIIDRLSANIIFHIIQKQNFAEQQMQVQQAHKGNEERMKQFQKDKALFKELLKQQKRMKNMSLFFYPPPPGGGGGGAPPATAAPALDQREKARIMKEIEDCLKKFGVAQGGGGGGGGGGV